MSKFTKTLVAAAVSGLVSTSALAAEYGCGSGFGFYETAQGKQAKLQINGQKCDKVKADFDMTLFVECGFEGFNTGFWESSAFDFGDEGNNDGPLIASKPGKTLVMDVTADGLDDFEDTMASYVFENCSDASGYNFDTELQKFEAKVSKNGDKVKVQWKSEGTYLDASGNKDKDRKVKTKLNAKLDNVD
mgnify:CR=1